MGAKCIWKLDLFSGYREQMGVPNPQKHPLAFERHSGPDDKTGFPYGSSSSMAPPRVISQKGVIEGFQQACRKSALPPHLACWDLPDYNFLPFFLKNYIQYINIPERNDHIKGLKVIKMSSNFTQCSVFKLIWTFEYRLVCMQNSH